jgi:hypothetical protein
MMPGWAVKMSRSNARSGTGRRKPDHKETLSPVLLNKDAGERGSSKKTQVMQCGPSGEPDVMQDALVDIDTILDMQAVHDTNDAVNTGIARRRIEMLREEQWLQSQLADSFDS